MNYNLAFSSTVPSKIIQEQDVWVLLVLFLWKSAEKLLNTTYTRILILIILNVHISFIVRNTLNLCMLLITEEHYSAL